MMIVTPRWTILGSCGRLEHACRCSCRRVLQTAFVPASFGGFLQVDSSSCRSTEVTAGRQRVLQVVNGSWRRVPGGKNSRAKLIIKILYILFYLRCQWVMAVVYIIHWQHVSVNEINNIIPVNIAFMHQYYFPFLSPHILSNGLSKWWFILRTSPTRLPLNGKS